MCGEYKIPNTVICYWAGNAGGLGSWWVDWEDSVTYLDALGFDAVEYTHSQSTYHALQSILERNAQAKVLHGLYFWGHGGTMGLYAGDGLLSVTDEVLAYMDHWDGPAGATYFVTGIDLPYKMALGLVFACYSNYGRYALVSNTPGCIWQGYSGVLNPTLDPDQFAADNYIKPGQQGTRLLP